MEYISEAIIHLYFDKMVSSSDLIWKHTHIGKRPKCMLYVTESATRMLPG